MKGIKIKFVEKRMIMLNEKHLKKSVSGEIFVGHVSVYNVTLADIRQEIKDLYCGYGYSMVLSVGGNNKILVYNPY